MDPAVTCCFSGHRPARLPWGRNEADPRCLALKARLDQALEEAGVRFDIVGLDPCLMATLETAFVLERHADHMLASQMEEPGCGWYYLSLIHI